MKAVIQPVTDDGLIVLKNMDQLSKIFNHKIVSWGIRQKFKKYTRNPPKITLERDDSNNMIFSMPENPTEKGSKKKILDAVNEVIVACDGKPEDCRVEVIL